MTAWRKLAHISSSCISIFNSSFLVRFVSFDGAFTKVRLKNSSALAIKNKALQHNAIAFIGNNVAIQKKSEIEKESAEQVPAGVELLPNERDVLIMPQEMDSEQDSDLEATQREGSVLDSEQGTFGPSYRVRFRFRHPQFGFRYGYRYPIWYWRRFGHRFYPARCYFGRQFGDFYYC